MEIGLKREYLSLNRINVIMKNIFHTNSTLSLGVKENIAKFTAFQLIPLVSSRLLLKLWEIFISLMTI